MEELLTLKELLHQGKISQALELVEELEEMSKSDKLNKILDSQFLIQAPMNSLRLSSDVR